MKREAEITIHSWDYVCFLRVLMGINIIWPKHVFFFFSFFGNVCMNKPSVGVSGLYSISLIRDATLIQNSG